MIQRAAESWADGPVDSGGAIASAATDSDELIIVLLDQLRLDEPIVRAELVLAARARLADGQRPSDADLAELLVDELAGGRLR